MAFHTQEADLPWIELPGGFKIVFEAISNTTGNAITGTLVTQVAVYGLTAGEAGGLPGGEAALGPYMFVPGPRE